MDAHLYLGLVGTFGDWFRFLHSEIGCSAVAGNGHEG